MFLLCNYNATPNELCFIMDSNGSEIGSYKDTTKYNYTKYYYALFHELKNQPIKIFSFGIDINKHNKKPGASLYGWRQFFNNAYVFAIDCVPDNIVIDKQIISFHFDYTLAKNLQEIWNLPILHEDFNIMFVSIPEKLHTLRCKQEVFLFESSHYKLLPGGVFIIENIPKENVNFYQDQLAVWRKKYPSYAFRLFDIPNPKNERDNRICTIQRLY